jgi:late competence protein required for DNA uptake (superfamily II DNA/RNA helicase)
MRKFSANLTHVQKQRRLHISSDLLHNSEMFDRVTAGDETWCFQYDPETERKSMQWKTQNSPQQKKASTLARSSRSHLCVSSVTSG